MNAQNVSLTVEKLHFYNFHTFSHIFATVPSYWYYLIFKQSSYNFKQTTLVSCWWFLSVSKWDEIFALYNRQVRTVTAPLKWKLTTNDPKVHVQHMHAAPGHAGWIPLSLMISVDSLPDIFRTEIQLDTMRNVATCTVKLVITYLSSSRLKTISSPGVWVLRCGTGISR